MAESISSRVAWKLRKVISGGSRDAPSRTGIATVQRRDADGTVWVRFPGSSIDTPVTGAVVANVAAGDTISYDLSGGRVSVTGNASDPSAGNRDVGAVRKIATLATNLAKDAKAIAEATGQYFWHDDNGAHVSTEEGNPTGYRNALWNSLGMLFRAGATNLLAIVAGSNSGIDVYDGDGNTSDNVVASLRKNALKLWSRAQGYTAQLVLTATSLTMYLDDSPGSAKTVMKLATSGSKIGSALTVDDPKDSVGNDIKIGNPDMVTSSFDSTNVAASTNKSIGHVNLGAGVWVVVALVAFPNNATGIRRIGLSDTNNSMPSTGPVVQMNASTAGPTRVFLTWIIDNGSATAGSPFLKPPLYLTAYQTSGSTLSCSGHIRAVHIS